MPGSWRARLARPIPRRAPALHGSCGNWDQDEKTREQAAWALGAIGDSRAAPGLLPALKDEDSGVRKQAAWALGVVGK
jgi:HEAT repeat protein